jgi:hypothetical protein
VWWIDYVGSGFTARGPVAAICVFRVLFAVACLMKFSVQVSHAYWHLLSANSYLAFLGNIRGDRLVLGQKTYRVLFVAKVVAACLLLVGAVVEGALVILAIEFAFELRAYFKFHTCFFLLVSVCLLLSPDVSQHLTVAGWARSGLPLRDYARAELSTNGDLFASFLIGVTATVMYFTSGVRKLNSDFLTGRTIFGTLRVTYFSRAQRQYWDGWYPSFFIRHFVTGRDEVLIGRWWPLTRITILLEWLLPLMLAHPTTALLGAVLGIVLHTLFTLMYPTILGHFSLAMVACYLLMFDPYSVAQIVRQ